MHYLAGVPRVSTERVKSTSRKNEKLAKTRFFLVDDETLDDRSLT